MSNILRVVFLPLVLLLATDCMVGDGDERCDARQELVEGACRCVEGTVPGRNGAGCVACGANEEVKGTRCECVAGYTRASEGGACVERAAGLGAACDVANNGCSAEFPECAPSTSGGGFCTESCDRHADCAAGFGCTQLGENRVCTPNPSGLMAKCTSADACAGFEANVCSVVGICLVGECGAANPCRGRTACCDYTGFRLSTYCIPEDQLESGACPFGAPMIGENLQ